MSIFIAGEAKEAYTVDIATVMQGTLSILIEKGIIKENSKIFIHKAIVVYLEKLASEGKASGIAGLEEIKRVNELARKKKLDVIFVGEPPRNPDFLDIIQLNMLVRETSRDMGAILITNDKISSLTAEAMGIKTLYIKYEGREKLSIEKFFDKNTMSIHLIEDIPPIAKKGTPGNWVFEEIMESPLSRIELERIIDELIEEARARDDSFIEIDRSGSTIIQLGRYRIVISRPPLSSRWEITAVRPLVKLSINDYGLPEKLLKRLEEKAEGILIAGAPGMGKTTFAQALAEFYSKKGKVVKTIESPRDMNLPPNIVQYSKNFADKDELHDILLLSRPDYTFFDELRGDEDFKLYVDLRLAGIGMVGVLHATTPIDAIQRFIGRVELGVIPSIIDTVIFIDKGKIEKVYEVRMTVKLPTGLKEADLSRPVVEVKDFMTGELEYEIYTFGEQTVVIPVKKTRKSRLETRLKRQLETLFPEAVIEMRDNTVVIKIPRGSARLVSRRAKKLKKLSEKHGIEFRFETQ